MIILLTVSPHWLMCSYFLPLGLHYQISREPDWGIFFNCLFLIQLIMYITLAEIRFGLIIRPTPLSHLGTFIIYVGKFSFNSAVKIRISLCLALFILEDKWIVKIENQKLWDITRFWTIAIRDINNMIFFSFRRGSISIFSVELFISNILLNTHAVLEYFSGCGMEEIQWL